MNEVVPQTLPLRDSQPVNTSGTVGTTIIDTITVIEHAARRCGVQPTSLTPENLDTGKNNLFFILSRLATRGLNLWAVDQFYLPVIKDKVRYALPPSTEGIVNIMYRRVQRLTALNTVMTNTTFPSLTFSADTKVSVFGFKLPADRSSRYIIEYTTDGSTWVVLQNFDDITLSAGWHWYALDASIVCRGIRLRDSTDTLFSVDDILAANSVQDLPLTRYNRDMYTQLNDKLRSGTPNSYYFEKKIESAITFWPVCQDETSYFVLWRHRAVQDVGSLSDRLEIPDRWFDTIIWLLAKNLAFELPNVTPDRLAVCVTQGDNAENYSELGESDGAPMFIRPNIGHYTK